MTSLFVKTWRWIALWVILTALLAGCSTTHATSCLPLRSYDTAFTEALATEIEQAPEDAVFPVAVGDYQLLREQIRAAGAAC